MVPRARYGTDLAGELSAEKWRENFVLPCKWWISGSISMSVLLVLTAPVLKFSEQLWLF